MVSYYKLDDISFSDVEGEQGERRDAFLLMLGLRYKWFIYLGENSIPCFFYEEKQKRAGSSVATMNYTLPPYLFSHVVIFGVLNW